MGSPLPPVIADFYMEEFERQAAIHTIETPVFKDTFMAFSLFGCME